MPKVEATSRNGKEGVIVVLVDLDEFIASNDEVLDKYINQDTLELINVDDYTRNEFQEYILKWVNLPLGIYPDKTKSRVKDWIDTLSISSADNWKSRIRQEDYLGDDSVAYQVVRQFLLHSYLYTVTQGCSSKGFIKAIKMINPVLLQLNMLGIVDYVGGFNVVNGGN